MTPTTIAHTLIPATPSPPPVTSASTTTPSKPICPPHRLLPEALSTTEYTVIIDPTSAPPFPEHICRDPSPIVRSVQINPATKAAEIKVLSGHWSAQEIRKNFIFKLEGKPSLNTISKYNDILFCYDYGHTISYLFSSYLISPDSITFCTILLHSVPFCYPPYASVTFLIPLLRISISSCVSLMNSDSL
jgi:hypothetical protein